MNTDNDNLASWTQFVLTFCERHNWRYCCVINNVELIEWLNILWLRRTDPFFRSNENAPNLNCLIPSWFPSRSCSCDKHQPY
jgi:hypothetical protein